MSPFYRVEGSRIVSPKGEAIMMRGVNVGGWLMMEGYFMHAPNLAAAKFKKEFAAALGPKALVEFEKSFHDNFITEEDFLSISSSGFNSVRLPFHHGLIEKKPYRYDPAGLAYLDRVIAWGKKYGLAIMLDLHAAPGAQNHDWHSDSEGKAGLWTSPTFQQRTIALWGFLADRYRDNPAVLGYDLLNEAVVPQGKTLADFYRKLIKAIRKADRNHIIFVEGNRWAQDVSPLDAIEDDNMAISIHFYEPIEMTFNFIPFLRYPLGAGVDQWDRSKMKKRLEEYALYAARRNRPVHVGEFGVNYRQGFYGEDLYVRDVVALFKELGFHWNYWTYKAVKNSMFPDGIYSYYPNPPWVNRQGPRTGWDTYASLWKAHKQEMARSWQTSEFTLNTHILKELVHGL